MQAASEKVQANDSWKLLSSDLMTMAAQSENYELALSQLQLTIEQNKKSFEQDSNDLDQRIKDAQAQNDAATLKDLQAAKEAEDLIQANTLRVYGEQKVAWSSGNQAVATHEYQAPSDPPAQPEQTVKVEEFKALANAELSKNVQTSWAQGCAAYGFSGSELPFESGKITFTKQDDKISTSKGVWKEVSEHGTCTLNIVLNADGTTKSRSGICRPNGP